MKFIGKFIFLICILFLSSQIYSQENETAGDDTAAVSDTAVEVPEVKEEKTPVKEQNPVKAEKPVKNSEVKDKVKTDSADKSGEKIFLLDVNDSDLLDGRIPGYEKKQASQMIVQKPDEKTEELQPDVSDSKPAEVKTEKTDYRAFGIVILIFIFIVVLYFMKTKKKRRRVFSTRR
ncbi:MAG: hypothetical protein JW982_10235 [Spirochaetes bacterium]|nr:hypothetical protein [Spirochaetota bacterium]